MASDLPASAPRARVLSNLPLPAVEGYALRAFGDYPAPGAAQASWRPELERRDLADILPLIPAAERPDVLVCASPEYLPIPRDVHAFRGTKVLLITDWNVCLRFLPDLLAFFDFAFVDWPGYRLLRRAGLGNVHHQPLFGHDPADFRDLGLPRTLDVSFCGNLNSGLHGERNRLAARLAVWSARARRPVHLRQAFGPAYVDVLNRSRLVFNYSIRGEANMRLFEAMACGAAPLVEEGNQEAPLLFQEGRHYFRYAPGRLEERVEELLARPERIAEAAEAARAEAPRHTKARQTAQWLETVCAASPGSPRPAPAARASKSLIKIRVLGSGYTLQDALAEVQARAAGLPGLDLETLPALLLTALDRNAPGQEGPVRQALDHLLRHPGLPEPVRRILRLGGLQRARDWEGALAAARGAREALAGMDPRVPYDHLLPPVDLGKGLNSDLNRAFREDLARPEASHAADLLRDLCRFAEAEALLRLGRPAEALAAAEGLPPAGRACYALHPLLLEARRALGDAAGLRAEAMAWFAEDPLDTAAWTAIEAALAGAGDVEARRAFLEAILPLAEAFLDRDQAGRISAMLAG